MAFAKKFTRQITVGADTYFWHLRDNSLDFELRHIAVRRADTAGQLLLVDPWPMGIRPKNIRAAILFALGHGWRPAEAGKSVYLGFLQDSFMVLSMQKACIYPA